MAVIPTYPGVYVEELSSGVRSVAALPTSITAFVGRALRGPTDDYDVPDQVPTVVNSYADYERIFGGLWTDSSMSYAVRDFFRNGGGQALIVRLFQTSGGQSNSHIAAATSDAGSPLNLISATPGSWGNRLRIIIDHDTRDTEPGETANSLFNLKIELIPDTGVASLQQLPDLGTRVEEIYTNVTCLPGLPHSLNTVLLSKSKLMRVEAPTTTAARPDAGTIIVNVSANDGAALTSGNFTGSAALRTGIHALLKADLFNILCIPPYLASGEVDAAVVTEAATLCRGRRAFLILDAPAAWDEISDVTSVATGVNAIATTVGTDNARNAAVFFPRLQMPNPLRQNQMETFASCGAVAGVFARTDVQRGVWKAPAGLDAGLTGTSALSVPMTDAENGQLNPLGVNCMRAMPGAGPVIWGSRTLRGADRLADTDWKYIPVRRLALFLEESIFRGTQWAVFEPNDEPLWSQLRMNIGAFLHTLFRQGAFQGSSPREAYFVKCDRSTTTQTDINNGIVNILIGYAPLKPAEFVILKFQQMAGQVQS
ncbi:MAG: phage tail sheath subtilisin-like domain-containing protein [Verrucomicrobia bacterium]|nr:phage tail sheath subtilisin-like domain-containing protein [Verrucomicrobiota bacterium]